MISKFFIERPVLANVIAILMVVIGIASLLSLPVSQYPDVVPPTVSVTTRYPGASATAVIDTDALPIEQQVNGVEGMLYMQSFAASDGNYNLTVTFAIGTDLDQAQVRVQNRVSSALASLPQSVQVQGVNVQKKSASILEIVTLTSPNGEYDSLYLANYATISLKDELSRIPGVGDVNVFGAGQYSMRVWLDPEKMRARSLTTQDVVQALQQQSEQVTAGQIVFQRDARGGVEGEAVVAGGGLALGAGEGVFLSRLWMQKHREIATHGQEALLHHFFRRGVHHDPVAVDM